MKPPSPCLNPDSSLLVPPLVIACGDHAGIGPEVTLKAVAAERRTLTSGVVLVGDSGELTRLRTQLNLDLAWSPYSPAESDAISKLTPPAQSPMDPCPVWVLDATPKARAGTGVGTPSSNSALAALGYLRRAATGCLRGEFAALVTAPVSKEAILRSGVPFVGQTEYFAEMAQVPDVTMMLLGDDDRGRWLRVALVTTHLPLKDVAASISQRDVTRAIQHAADACRKLKLPRTRVGVAGLNPHAGEGGMLGDEEIRVIRPGIRDAQLLGVDVHGPVPGDTLFHQAHRGDFDAVVAMYHDQGLAPLKLIAFDRGVNWTLGLPFVRTSPDHGTAFDIAGKGMADPSSMQAAIRLASRLAEQ